MLQSLKKEVEAGEVMVNQLADRLSVKILDKILFASGEATISAKGQNVLKRVGKVLAQARDKDKVIRIEGHTDTVPIGTKIVEKFATNWELSTARATTVVRFMAETSKIPPDGFEAAGLGEYHPRRQERHARRPPAEPAHRDHSLSARCVAGAGIAEGERTGGC